MKKILTILFLSTICLASIAEDKWHPIPSWPFVYSDFLPAVIHTHDGKALQVQANIHIGRHKLWYKSSKQENLEAKAGLIRDIRFSNNERYIEVNKKICLIVREDTIKNKVHRLLQSTEVDMPRYNEAVRDMKMAESSSSFDIAGLNDLNLDMSVRESSEIAEQQPLPLQEVYYIQIDNNTFEATESNILKNLSGKEERNAYRAYTRKAEVLTGNVNSMLDVYTTFFLK